VVPTEPEAAQAYETPAVREVVRKFQLHAGALGLLLHRCYVRQHGPASHCKGRFAALDTIEDVILKLIGVEATGGRRLCCSSQLTESPGAC
jgi:hypothetical protein